MYGSLSAGEARRMALNKKENIRYRSYISLIEERITKMDTPKKQETAMSEAYDRLHILRDKMKDTVSIADGLRARLWGPQDKEVTESSDRAETGPGALVQQDALITELEELVADLQDKLTIMSNDLA